LEKKGEGGVTARKESSALKGSAQREDGALVETKKKSKKAGRKRDRARESSYSKPFTDRRKRGTPMMRSKPDVQDTKKGRERTKNENAKKNKKSY